MSHEHYLLFISKSPVDASFRNYFAQFNLEIMQQVSLQLTINEHTPPNAILIDSAILKHNPQRLSELYNTYAVPLIVISDVRDEESSIVFLEAGADDFLVKPLHPRELHARIGAITRRVAKAKDQRSEKEVFYFANWRLYPSSRQVFNENNQELLLSTGEYDLLLMLIQHPRTVLDREMLLQMDKHSSPAQLDRRVDVQISRLRQKLEKNTKKPALIKTIRNGGYMFTSEVIVVIEKNA